MSWMELAARTALLSDFQPSGDTKLSSSIVLDELQFPLRNHNHIGIDRFAELAKLTFPRHEESNHSIDTFRLRLITDSYARLGLATQWTLNALKLGATDLTFQSYPPNIAIPLKEAVFGNKNIVRLCLESSTIDRLQVTECPGLKALTLRDLAIIKLNALFDIISCCPSVEDLSLSNISWRGNIEDLKSTARVPTLILHDLRSLVLCDVNSIFQIKTLFIDDLSSKFPNLKHLTLGLTQNSFGPKLEVINISSASLETLNITMEQLGNRVPKFEFDVPSIRKFTFEVDSEYIIPDVLISGSQWEESHVWITKCNQHKSITNGINTKWVCQLRNFLKKLRGSKIHLCLHMHNKEIFDYGVGELDGLNVCEVEDLTLDIPDLSSLGCHVLLDGLFRICRPKTITQYVRPPDNNKNNDHAGLNTRNNDLVICRSLERIMQVKSVMLPTQFMYGFRDLEEVNAQQLFDGEWKQQPLGSILADAADSTSQKSKRRFRFQLKWKL